jgi:hypothetical protein
MMRVRVSYFVIAMQARTTSTSGIAISPIDAVPDDGHPKNEWLGQDYLLNESRHSMHLDLHSPREERGVFLQRREDDEANEVAHLSSGLRCPHAYRNSAEPMCLL